VLRKVSRNAKSHDLGERLVLRPDSLTCSYCYRATQSAFRPLGGPRAHRQEDLAPPAGWGRRAAREGERGASPDAPTRRRDVSAGSMAENDLTIWPRTHPQEGGKGLGTPQKRQVGELGDRRRCLTSASSRGPAGGTSDP
jgi:hypothetical protein